jgi:hypothetical protein
MAADAEGRSGGLGRQIQVIVVATGNPRRHERSRRVVLLKGVPMTPGLLQEGCQAAETRRSSQMALTWCVSWLVRSVSSRVSLATRKLSVSRATVPTPKPARPCLTGSRLSGLLSPMVTPTHFWPRASAWSRALSTSSGRIRAICELPPMMLARLWSCYHHRRRATEASRRNPLRIRPLIG